MENTCRYRLIICMGLVSLCFFLVPVPVHADEVWDDYDVLWARRNPQARLTVLDRAAGHYEAALDYFKNKAFAAAERYAKDALKVIPHFAESYSLLADIYAGQGKHKKAARFRRMSEEKKRAPSVLEERAYMRRHINRLMSQYTPSTGFNRIVFYLLFLIGYGFMIFFVIASGFLTDLSMRFQHIQRVMKEKKSPLPDLVIDEFPGEEKEKKLPWYTAAAVYAGPFLLSFLVSLLCGARSQKDLVLLTLFPGLFIAVVLHKVFLSDSDAPLPPRFPRM